MTPKSQWLTNTILSLQAGCGYGLALLTRVQLCLTPAPILHAGPLNTRLFLELRLSAGVQEDQEKICDAAKASVQNWHTIAPSHILLLKRNHISDLKEI